MGIPLRTAGVAALVALVAPAPVVAEDAGGGVPAAAPAEVTAEQRDAAIARGCKWLDEHLYETQDGGSPQRQYAQGAAAWAYLLLTSSKAGAPIPPRAKELDRLSDDLDRWEERIEDLYAANAKDEKKKAKKRKDAAPADGTGAAGGPFGPTQWVWPLGTIAHFHAEAVLRKWHGKDSRTALTRVAKVLEACQQPDGGWGHDDATKPGMGIPAIKIPLPGGDRDYPPSLLAAAYCGLAGLGVAERTLGMTERPSLTRGREYFAGSQLSNGTWPYDPSQKGVGDEIAGAGQDDETLGIEFARTGGCAYAVAVAGASPTDPMLVHALGALEHHTAILSESHGSATLGLQYGAMLARSRGPGRWAEFRSEFFPRLLAAQAADGSFDCACRHKTFGTTCDTKSGVPGLSDDTWTIGCRAYVTAVHVLILTLDREAPRALPEVPDTVATPSGDGTAPRK